MIRKTVIFTAAILIAFACSTTKKVTDISIGTWDYVVKNTPEGDMTGDFVIAKEGDSYTGFMNSSQGSVQLRDVKIEDNNLSCNFDFSGYKIIMTGVFEGNNFNGKVSADYNEFVITATKNP